MWWFGFVLIGLTYFLRPRAMWRGAHAGGLDRGGRLVDDRAFLRRCSRNVVPVLPHRLPAASRTDRGQPDRPPADAAPGRAASPRMRCRTCSTAMPAAIRSADVLIIGAGSGNDVSRALVWGAERVDAVEIDPVIQRIGQAGSSQPAVRRLSSHGALERRPQLPEGDDQTVRPHHLRAGRFARAAQQLQQHPARKLPVHEAGDGRRAQPLEAGRRLRHVQLLPAGLDRVASAELGARRVWLGCAGAEPAEPRHAPGRREPWRRVHDADRRRNGPDPRRVRAPHRVLDRERGAARLERRQRLHRRTAPERGGRVAAVPPDPRQCRIGAATARHR